MVTARWQNFWSLGGIAIPFWEGGGQIVHAYGGGNPGPYSFPGNAQFVDSERGRSFRFDGVNDFVDVLPAGDPGANPGLGDFSVGVLLKFTTIANVDTVMGTSVIGAPADGRGGWSLGTDTQGQAGEPLEIELAPLSGTDTKNYRYPDPILDEWAFYMFTWSNQEDRLLLYKDGVEVAPVGLNNDDTLIGQDIVPAAADRLRIGNRTNATGRAFPGEMSIVYLMPWEASASEVSALAADVYGPITIAPLTPVVNVAAAAVDPYFLFDRHSPATLKM